MRSLYKAHAWPPGRPNRVPRQCPLGKKIIEPFCYTFCIYKNLFSSLKTNLFSPTPVRNNSIFFAIIWENNIIEEYFQVFDQDEQIRLGVDPTEWFKGGYFHKCSSGEVHFETSENEDPSECAITCYHAEACSGFEISFYNSGPFEKKLYACTFYINDHILPDPSEDSSIVCVKKLSKH